MCTRYFPSVLEEAVGRSRSHLATSNFSTFEQVIRKSDNQVYAMKKVNIRSMAEREVADALNEIRFLASLHHPNVVGFLEAFLDKVSQKFTAVASPSLS